MLNGHSGSFQISCRPLFYDPMVLKYKLLVKGFFLPLLVSHISKLPIRREIVFLKEFGSHPNIIQLLNVHRAANDKDLYLVFEFMETDLHHVIKKGNILKGIHRQYIMYQLFKATQVLPSTFHILILNLPSLVLFQILSLNLTLFKRQYLDKK